MRDVDTGTNQFSASEASRQPYWRLRSSRTLPLSYPAFKIIPRHVRNTRCGTADIKIMILASPRGWKHPILHAVIPAKVRYVSRVRDYKTLISGPFGISEDRGKLSVS